MEISEQHHRLQIFIASLIEKIKTGHPGTAISLTPLFYTLFTKILEYDPDDSRYASRDILILSNGHACAVLYLFLHLTNRISFNDLLEFRQIHSNTPGHPETSTDGVEVVTGPLGQGLGASVGFGISIKKVKNELDNILEQINSISDNIEKIKICNKENVNLKSNDKIDKNFMKKLVKDRKDTETTNSILCKNDIFHPAVFCIFGDGCYQEGISHEAFSLACHYKLDNVIFIYDSNEITIEGDINLSMSDCPRKRFQGYGFDVLEADGNDCDKIEKILKCKLKIIRNNYNKNDQEDRSYVLKKDNEYIFKKDKPFVLILKTKIAVGTDLEGNSKSHGAPLGEKVVENFKKKYNLENQDLFIKKEIYDVFNKINDEMRKKRFDWNLKVNKIIDKYKKVDEERKLEKEINILEKHKNEYQTNLLKNFLKIESKIYYDPNHNTISNILKSMPRDSGKKATRVCMSEALREISIYAPFLLSGSADLSPSCLTKNENTKDIIEIEDNNRCASSLTISKKHNVNFDNSYLRYGIREHGMFSAANGISSHGFYLPLTSTFLNFITYGWHSVRLSAIACHSNIYIMTHDSICLGDDGPTHQPIEVLALLRSTPNIVTLRPCDSVETRFSLWYGIYRTTKNIDTNQSIKDGKILDKCDLKKSGPIVICLSRQGIDIVRETDFDKCEKGAYVVFRNYETEKSDDNSSKKKEYRKINEKNLEIDTYLPEITILASGSEVSLAIDSAKNLSYKVNVVSFISFELFEIQNSEYKNYILNGFVVSIEAQSTLPWYKYSDFCIGINEFGLSGKGEDVYSFFGFTTTKICEKIVDQYTIFLKK